MKEFKIPEGAQWAIIYTDGDDVHINADFGSKEPEIVAMAFAETLFETLHMSHTMN